jgi:hypothetical protein
VEFALLLCNSRKTFATLNVQSLELKNRLFIRSYGGRNGDISADSLLTNNEQ